MSLHTILRTQILTDSAISTLIGGKRFYPIQLPTENRALPAITSQIVSRENFPDLTGISSLCKTRISIRTCSSDFDEADSLSNKVRTFLEGTSGTWSGVAISGVYCANYRIDDFDPDTQIYYCLQDYFITHPRLT